MSATATDVPFESVTRAARDLEGVAVRTRLVPLSLPDTARLGGPVFLKCEQDQPIGAFKIRGAYTAIVRLPEERRTGGVITYSSGNHGQAVAFAARELGLRAVVVVNSGAPAVKLEGIRRLGGEVVDGGPTSVSRQERAEAIAREEGLAIVPPFDHPDVIAGQATCTLEILEDCPDIATLVIPVGGGGLLAGACVVARERRPGLRIVAVEPVGAAKLSAALEAGRPVPLESTASLADGLLPLSIGRLTFPLIQPLLDRAVRVTDEQIAEAVKYLSHTANLRVEPSGAATTAAILAGLVPPAAEAGATVAIVSGGNVDDAVFQRLVG